MATRIAAVLAGVLALASLAVFPTPSADAAPFPGHRYYAFGTDGFVGNHKLAYSSPTGSAVVKEIPCDGSPASTVVVPSGTSVESPLTLPLTAGTTVTSSNLVQIFSTHPIGAQQLLHGGATADAAQLLQVDQWDLEYQIATYQNDNTFLAIVADQPSTVTVIPSVSTVGGGPLPPLLAGVPFTFPLAPCEAAQIVGIGDLTGTTVKADVPVGVYAGVQCATVPLGAAWCDSLVEQTWPVAHFADEYVLCRSPTRGVEPDLLRIMALNPSTTVTVGSASSTLFAAGDHIDVPVSGDVVVSATSPVTVLQLLQGSSTTGPIDYLGDPAMTQLHPTVTPWNKFAFHTYAHPDFTVSFMTAAVPAGSGPTLDGLPVTAHPIPGTSWACARQIGLLPGLHTVDTAMPTGGVQFGAYGHHISYLAPALGI